ncbi:FAD-dependent monooxygenase [Saccharopolyspora indica]|uniref:FAD-dependent oxidoreductase n=1 Tax=Saccharopolyspora indica TaxID=1229659 RepID=UPI0022EB8617|nr:NAD(P)/FAD-dependent oxidoreductase [Saccharopolyspora indica]MDA3644126.1 NAD(P)/FAD-dependent oxidoreductase [Saccharopolyspora indica]
MNESDGYADCGIVGGGPAGLLLALLLARHGWRVSVVDKNELRDTRMGKISPFLSPPSLELFDELGFMDELARVGQPVREVVEHTATGEQRILDYASDIWRRHPYIMSVPLPTLTGVLHDALEREPTAAVLPGTSVRRLTDAPDGGHRLDLADARQERTMTCRYLICSDGKFSPMRTAAGIEVDVFDFDRPAVFIILPQPPGWPERVDVHHAADSSWLGVMPVANGQLAVQWVGDPADFDEVRSAGVAELRARVSAFRPDLEQWLGGLTDWDQLMVAHHHVVQPHVWSRGSLGLLGDSAHGVHAIGAQGLNMAVQDALVLADRLIRAAGGEIAAPLASYEALRRPFVKELQLYQMGLPHATTQGDQNRAGDSMYAGIAQLMANGQPEVRPCYERVVTAGRD